jgi:diacylglycerol kinase (ATP)
MNPDPEATSGSRSGLAKSFVFAWRGIVELIRSQRNARVHLLVTAVVAIVGLLLRISAGEWAALVLAMGLVWTAEAMNTAIEFLGDRITSEHDELIRRAKDVAAGGVLLASIAAAVTGFVILGPRLCALVMR